MLKPVNRKACLEFSKDDLVVLGMMSATKLFGLPDEVFASLKGNNTPFVGVVMFGNGYYGKSLKQMKKEMASRGFKMVAAAAFIGQHTLDPEIAPGRPDASDRAIQRALGRDVHEKVRINRDLSFNHAIKTDWPHEGLFSTFKCALISALPMSSPKLSTPWKEKAFTGDCIGCRSCEKRCPVNAVDIDTRTFDYDRCIGCFACGHACPRDAITITSARMKKAMASVKPFRIQTRREPVVFI